MNAITITHATAASFVDVFAAEDFAHDVAPRMSCAEVDAVISMLRAVGGEATTSPPMSCRSTRWTSSAATAANNLLDAGTILSAESPHRRTPVCRTDSRGSVSQRIDDRNGTG
jgi:hypothetical protein